MPNTTPNFLSRPHVFWAGDHQGGASELGRALPEAQVVFVSSAEALLREAHATPPDVLLLANTLPSEVPLPDLLTMLRGRPGLAHTRWLVMGERGLGAFLSAGADALVASNTPTAALAQLLRNHLVRLKQVRDLEERLRDQQQRLETWGHEERVRDQLVHMLVHDLKNPISAVSGLLDVVIEDAARVPRDLLDLLRLAREESQHLLHLAVNMLDVRKMQAGKMNLKCVTLFAPSLRDVLDQAQGDVGVGIGERELSVDLPFGLDPVRADPEILRRVFANLLSNAVKHTTRGGKIRLAVRPVEDALEWRVQDDGEGIPAEDIPKLFSAFEQSRLTLHSRFDTGMGLAFCKLAVEGHGGQIWVESERGKGATFHFTLPFVREEEEDFVEVLQ